MPAGVISTTWSWPSSTASRVCSMNAETSLARKFSPSPRPTTSGELRRAATTASGTSTSTASSVNAPSQPAHRRGACASASSCGPSAAPASRSARISAASRCAAHSVSVSLANSTPVASSSARSRAKFSMMPLWITATRPSADRCGWALRSVGPPWVAQRVCPMAVVPAAMPSAGALGQRLLQVGELAGLLLGQDDAVVDDRDAGGVISAVLQPAQPVEDDTERRTTADVTHDPTHVGQRSRLPLTRHAQEPYFRASYVIEMAVRSAPRDSRPSRSGPRCPAGCIGAGSWREGRTVGYRAARRPHRERRLSNQPATSSSHLDPARSRGRAGLRAAVVLAAQRSARGQPTALGPIRQPTRPRRSRHTSRRDHPSRVSAQPGRRTSSPARPCRSPPEPGRGRTRPRHRSRPARAIRPDRAAAGLRPPTTRPLQPARLRQPGYPLGLRPAAGLSAAGIRPAARLRPGYAAGPVRHAAAPPPKEQRPADRRHPGGGPAALRRRGHGRRAGRQQRQRTGRGSRRADHRPTLPAPPTECPICRPRSRTCRPICRACRRHPRPAGNGADRSRSTYEVTGDGPAEIVYIEKLGDDPQRVSNAKLPWKFTTTHGGRRPGLGHRACRGTTESGKISCRATVDGEEVAQRTARGQLRQRVLHQDRAAELTSAGDREPDARSRPIPWSTRMRPFGTTIFTEMSALAVRTGSVNLGQGFPDTDGPPEMLAAAAEALRVGRQPVPAAARHPRPAGRDRRARAAVLGSDPGPGHRGGGHRGRHRGGRGERSSGCASRATRWCASSRTTTRTRPRSPWPAPSGGRSRCARARTAGTVRRG